MVQYTFCSLIIHLKMRKDGCPFLFYMVITYSKGKGQPGKVANPACGQLSRENDFPLSPFAPENLVSRDRFGSSVPRQPIDSPY